MSVVGTLADFVATASASALPQAEQDLLRLHFTDTAVAALAGAHIAEGRALAAFSDPNSLGAAIGRQAAAIRLTEIDDIHLPSCTTPSSAVLPVALTVTAQSGDFDLSQIASAMWVGTELMTRFGEAVRGPDVLYRGIWPTYLGAPLAAAATAARMWGLDAADRARAVACVHADGGRRGAHSRHAVGPLVAVRQCGRRRRYRRAGGARGLSRRPGVARRQLVCRYAWDCAGHQSPHRRTRAQLDLSAAEPETVLLGQAGHRGNRSVPRHHRGRRAHGNITRVRVRVPPAYAA